MIHRLIPVFHEEYNMLQIIVKHEKHSEESKNGYYMMVSLLKIVEGDNPSIKIYKTHARQLIKPANAESSFDDKALKDIVLSYLESINAVFNVSLLSRDF